MPLKGKNPRKTLRENTGSHKKKRKFWSSAILKGTKEPLELLPIARSRNHLHFIPLLSPTKMKRKHCKLSFPLSLGSDLEALKHRVYDFPVSYLWRLSIRASWADWIEELKPLLFLILGRESSDLFVSKPRILWGGWFPSFVLFSVMKNSLVCAGCESSMKTQSFQRLPKFFSWGKKKVPSFICFPAVWHFMTW